MMNKNKNCFSALLACVLVVIALPAFAQAIVLNTTDQPPSQAPVATTLEDRVHLIRNELESVTAIHHYHFTAVRGQTVLLAIPDASSYGKHWRLDYRIASGEWNTKHWNGPEKIENLSPGTSVEVRVMAVGGVQFDKAGYTLAFGSYPHMYYDFHHEKGFMPIPHGLTAPAFLATQALTEALLEVSFTDSKGHPLEGGVVAFSFRPNAEVNTDTTLYSSDRHGKIAALIKFNRCEGGEYAEPFVHINNGRNTWATRYKVGAYQALNVLPGALADKPHRYDFGHVCKRWLVNWSRN
ncbi:fibronectin type III domain-containing protein [Pseudomonas sp. Leaf127]|uniref:fibronectin type III domain-containing protein n=1 Tax=Pseudomonas sp. Leaf127 TaxID=1736267 RepID=UPI000AA3FFF8|nr:fibronectin type III domain-containing protein [Pseudomonas sp. Leaf127]